MTFNNRWPAALATALTLMAWATPASAQVQCRPATTFEHRPKITGRLLTASPLAQSYFRALDASRTRHPGKLAVLRWDCIAGKPLPAPQIHPRHFVLALAGIASPTRHRSVARRVLIQINDRATKSRRDVAPRLPHEPLATTHKTLDVSPQRSSVVHIQEDV